VTDHQQLEIAAFEDAEQIIKLQNRAPRSAAASTGIINLDKVGAKDASMLVFKDHKALGYRPPSGSLAAQARRFAAKHPDVSVGLNPVALRDAARADAENIMYVGVFFFLFFSIPPIFPLRNRWSPCFLFFFFFGDCAEALRERLICALHVRRVRQRRISIQIPPH
jgi:hypothetical protein